MATNRYTQQSIDEHLLQVALMLANAPPVSSWQAKDVKHHREVLNEFLIWSTRPDRRQMLGSPPYKPSRETMGDLRKRIRAMLRLFLAGGNVGVAIKTEDVPLKLETVRDKNGDSALRVMRGPYTSVWTLGLAYLLVSPTGARLRRCPDEKCGRYFLRRGRMEYCSVRCSRRVYMRKYRL